MPKITKPKGEIEMAKDETEGGVEVTPETAKKIEEYVAKLKNGELPVLSPEASLTGDEERIEQGNEILTLAREFINKPKPPTLE